MITKAKKYVWPLLCIGLLLAILVMAIPDTKSIRCGSRTTLWQRIPVFGVHFPPENYIQIGAKKFSGVEGSLPFFVPIRGSDLIAFVTVGRTGRKLHIARPSSCELVMSVSITSYFRSWIGRASLEQDEYDEAILLPLRSEILLTHSTTSGIRRTLIDLQTKTLTSEVDK